MPWIETSRILGLDSYAHQQSARRRFASHLDFEMVAKAPTYIDIIRDPVDGA
jgi:hypothetical protein